MDTSLPSQPPPGQKGLKVKGGLQALPFTLGAAVSWGGLLQGTEGWWESYPTKSKSDAIWRPWLHVS